MYIVRGMCVTHTAECKGNIRKNTRRAQVGLTTSKVRDVLTSLGRLVVRRRCQLAIDVRDFVPFFAHCFDTLSRHIILRDSSVTLHSTKNIFRQLLRYFIGLSTRAASSRLTSVFPIKLPRHVCQHHD